jgi:N-acetylmuramoyl-L-alanine amidase
MIHQRLQRINRVVLSIGHDAKAKGAEANGYFENDLCRKIAGYLTDYLSRNSINVLLLPDYSLPDTLRYIRTQCNTITDMVIEIHKDSTEPYQKETMHRRVGLYYFDEKAGAGSIAKAMIATMITEGGHKSSWTRTDIMSNHRRLGFCRDLRHLSYIAEMGFVEGDNSDEECKWYAESLGKAIILVLDKKPIDVPNM